VTAPVSIKLPTDCWRFVDETRSWPSREPLAADVQTVLNDPPRLEMGGAVPAPRVVITMTRAQAEAFQRWLREMHDSLKHDDERRLACLMCISRVAVAIMLSERS
jgi:hypothetical protein